MTLESPRPTRPWHLRNEPGDTPGFPIRKPSIQAFRARTEPADEGLDRLAAESHWRLLLPAAGGTESLWRCLGERLGGLSVIGDYRLGLSLGSEVGPGGNPNPDRLSEAVSEPILTLPVEREGRVLDLLLIALESGDFRTVAGRAWLLGQPALAAAREGAILTLYADPLSWLRGWEFHAAPARAAAREGMLIGTDGASWREAATPLLGTRLAAIDRAAAEPGRHGLCVLAPEACDWEALLSGIDEIEVPDPDFRRWLSRRLAAVRTE